jgi:hypothetical protein
MSERLRGLKLSSLSLFFAALLLVALVGQAVSGVAQRNREQLEAGLDPLSLGRYLTSSSFAVDVTENWQSEFLQFLLFVLATVWLVQHGSPESKKPEDVGREDDEKQQVAEHSGRHSPSWARVRGWRLTVYQHSLGLMMGAAFLASWLVQSVTGAVAYSEEQMRELADPVSWGEYIGLPDFWNRTMQNWQSEFLAVLCMVIFSIYLRERGSPESKPVGASHDATGVEG